MRRPSWIVAWVLLSSCVAWAEPTEKPPGSEVPTPASEGSQQKPADAPRRLAQHYHAVFNILKKASMRNQAECEKALDKVGAYLVRNRSDFSRIRKELDDPNPERAAKLNQRLQATLAKVYQNHMKTVHVFGERCRDQLHELEELLDQAVLGKPTAHSHEGHSNDDHAKKKRAGENDPTSETPDAGSPGAPLPHF